MTKFITFFILLSYTLSFSQTQIVEVVPPIYDEIKPINFDFILLKNDNEVKYLDRVNRKIYKKYYESIYKSKNKTAIAVDENKCFHVDSTGKPLYSSKYDKCSSYIGSLALVRYKKYQAIINKEGEKIFKKRNTNILYFDDEIILYEHRKNRFLVDYNENIIYEGDLKIGGNIIYTIDSVGINIINKNGFIKNKYQEIDFISSNYNFYKKDGENGIIDKDYNEIVTFDYKRETENIGMNKKNDSILFLIKNKKWALFNIYSGLKTGFQFDRLQHLDKGLIIATVGSKKGLIDANGKIITDFFWEQIYKTTNSKWINVTSEYSNQNIIDYKGNVLFNPKTKYSGFNKCIIINDSLFIVRKNKSAGIINDKLEIIAPLEYKSIKPFKNGFGWATKVYKKEGEKIRFEGGFINLKGEYKNAEVYDYSNTFYNGYATVKKDSTYSVIDSTFKTVIPFQKNITNVIGPNEGYFVARKNNKYGYIDVNGKVVIDFKFNSANRFYNGLAKVNFKSYIDTKGKIVYDSISYDNRPLFDKYNIAKVKSNNKWGIIGDKYQLIIPFKYDEASIINNNYIEVSMNNRYGIINKSDNIVLEIEHNDIINIKDDFYYLDSDVLPNQIIWLNNNKVIKTDYIYIKDLLTSNNASYIRNDSKFESSKLVLIKKNEKYGIIELINSTNN